MNSHRDKHGRFAKGHVPWHNGTKRLVKLSENHPFRNPKVNYWKGRKMSTQHKLNIGLAKQKWWASLPEKRKKEIREARKAGLKKRFPNGRSHRREKQGFLFRSGDIEVYVLRIGHRSRGPKDLPGGWSRTLHKRPKLTKAQRYRKWIKRDDT